MTLDAIHGLILNVYVKTAGSAMLNDAYDGDSLLVVEDATDFPEAPASLATTDGATHNYTAIDYATGEIVLEDTLAANQLAGSFIACKPLRTVMWTDIQLDGHDDPLTVRVPHHLRAYLPQGSRTSSDMQEDALVIFEGTEWVLWDVQGVGPLLGDPRRTFRYTATGVPAAGYRGVKLTGYGGRFSGFQVFVDGNSSASDADFDLLKNGDVIASVTIQAGKLHSNFDAIDVGFRADDVIRVRWTHPRNVEPNVYGFAPARLSEGSL